MRAKKSLGQNFLVDPNLQRKIVDALDVRPDDTVLEIGPGRGALTRRLAGRSACLVLVELDDRLAADLAVEFAERPGIRVVHADALETPLTSLFPDPTRVKVIGNIPYNITSPLLFHLLERPRPAEILVMVQREVADRLVAAPGSAEYGALAVGVQSVADVARVLHMPRGAFRPVPGVDSTVVRITPHAPPRLSAEEERDLRRVVRAAFQWRRKQLQKILRDHPDLSVSDDEAARLVSTLGVEPSARPETLSPDAFLVLARALRARPV